MSIPVISIIVPVFNGAKYIDGLFAQLSAQEDSRVELVFVDDGSTDDSFLRIKMWQERVKFPVLIHRQENQGVSVARNVGAKLARGEFLTYVDVDDAVADDYVETLLCAARDEMDVLVFQSGRITAHFDHFERHDRNLPTSKAYSGSEMLCRFWEDPTRLGTYNLMLRTEFVQKVGLSFPVGYKYYEDYDYLLQVFAQTDRIVVLERVLYFYLMRENSAMARFTSDRIACLELMEKRALWLKEKCPDFAEIFNNWGVSRLYWSVLWQAALALRTFQEFLEFAQLTHARCNLKKLRGYPDRLVRVSSRVFMVSKRAYWTAVRLTGHKKSKVLPVSMEELRRDLMHTGPFC